MPVSVRVGKKIVVIAMKDGKGTVKLAGKSWQVDPDNRVLRKRERRRGRRRDR
jgi:membrane protein implicated in regulation of membrane protease activity